MYLMTLGSSCEWDHAVYLASSLSIMFSRLIHVVMCIRMSFLFMALSYSISWMDHIWFRPPPIGRRWLFPVFGSCEQCCCEQGKTDEQFRALLSALPCVHPEVGWLDYMAILCSTALEKPLLSPATQRLHWFRVGRLCGHMVKQLR